MESSIKASTLCKRTLVFAYRSAKSSEVAALASQMSAEAARESVAVQKAAWTEEKLATLVWVDVHFRWEIESTTQGNGMFTIGFRNEGRGPAFDTRLAAFYHQNGRHSVSFSAIGTFNDETMQYRRAWTPNVMLPQDIHLFQLDASKDDIGEGTKRHVTFIANYRDKLGEHCLTLKMWFGGFWGADGFTFSIRQTTLDAVLTPYGDPKDHEHFRVDGEIDSPYETQTLA